MFQYRNYFKGDAISSLKKFKNIKLNTIKQENRAQIKKKLKKLNDLIVEFQLTLEKSKKTAEEQTNKKTFDYTPHEIKENIFKKENETEIYDPTNPDRWVFVPNFVPNTRLFVYFTFILARNIKLLKKLKKY